MRLFQKIHADPARMAREHGALTTWAARLGASPRVIDTDNTTLWLAEVPGESGSSGGLPNKAWTAAGAWLRAAHNVADVPTDSVPLPRALKQRLRGVAKRARRVLPTAWVDQCLARVGDPARLATRRVWCHRDFTPDNWVWDGPAQKLWVLDFEHARPDLPWSDLVKLEATEFVDQPTTRRAFYAGYGRPPSPEHRDAHVVWHGLATLTWGLQHDEPDFAALGRRILTTADLPPPLPSAPVRSRP